MHIPDGFLNSQINFSLTAVSLIAGSFSLKKVKESLLAKSQVLIPQLVTSIGTVGQSKVVSRWFFKKAASRKIQEMIFVFCLVFMIQLVDFVKIGQVPAHLLGSFLAALVLGPFAAVLVISAVLAVQAWFLGDGGVLSLGTNIFNMAIVGCIASYYLFIVFKKLISNRNLAIGLVAWLSVMIMVLFFTLEAIMMNKPEGIYQLIQVHAVSGVVEAGVTILALKYLFFGKAYEK